MQVVVQKCKSTRPSASLRLKQETNGRPGASKRKESSHGNVRYMPWKAGIRHPFPQYIYMEWPLVGSCLLLFVRCKGIYEVKRNDAARGTTIFRRDFPSPQSASGSPPGSDPLAANRAGRSGSPPWAPCLPLSQAAHGKMATSTASMRGELPNGEMAQILIESCHRRAEEQSSLGRALFSLA
jgi:hypothetical protein